jgi:DNA-binding SARP family transcriptional activator
MEMDFRLLGPLEVAIHDGPVALGGSKQRAVLAHLLLRANTVVPSERLIDEVWGDLGRRWSSVVDRGSYGERGG